MHISLVAQLARSVGDSGPQILVATSTPALADVEQHKWRSGACSTAVGTHMLQKQSMPGRAQVPSEERDDSADTGQVAASNTSNPKVVGLLPTASNTAGAQQGHDSPNETTDKASPSANSEHSQQSAVTSLFQGVLRQGVGLAFSICIQLRNQAHCGDSIGFGSGATFQIVLFLFVLVGVALVFLACVVIRRSSVEDSGNFVPLAQCASVRNDRFLVMPNAVHAPQMPGHSRPGTLGDKSDGYVAGHVVGDVDGRALPRINLPQKDIVVPLSQAGGGCFLQAHVDKADDFLCPDMVVPPNRQCTVAVPVVATTAGVFSVMDLRGSLLFQIASGRGPGAASGFEHPGDANPDLKEFALVFDQSVVLARCSAELSGAAFSISKPSGIRFARVALHGNGNYPGNVDGASRHCLLTTGRGTQLYFSGDAFGGHVKVSDSEGDYVADTELCSVSFDEPSTQYICLRVTSNHDVGLVICGLFATRVMFASLGR